LCWIQSINQLIKSASPPKRDAQGVDKLFARLDEDLAAKLSTFERYVLENIFAIPDGLILASSSASALSGGGSSSLQSAARSTAQQPLTADEQKLDAELVALRRQAQEVRCVSP
jgi:hypothetical protein